MIRARRALAAGLLSSASLALAAAASAEPLEVDATPIEAFETRAPDNTTFGRLTFLGGLQLDSSEGRFGGLSGIEVSGDGDDLLLVSDEGDLIRARLVTEEGRPAGLADVELWPLTNEDGETLGGKWGSDAESLRGLGGGFSEILVGFERDNRVRRYEVAENGKPGAATPFPVPEAIRRLPHNTGLEGIAVAPDGAPEPGLTVMFRESETEDGTIPGWLFDAEGAPLGTLAVAASDDFSATDAVFTDTGDLILLERRYKPIFGVAMRLRRFPADEIRPGAVLQGEELFMGRMNYVIDNMEGIAFHRDGEGRAVLTLVSDDNFNILQRNLLLRFELAE